MKGRFIGENIRFIYDFMYYIEYYNIFGFLMLIDFEKVFDIILWSFILKILDFFNFGFFFKNWIKIFYNGIKVCVI